MPELYGPRQTSPFRSTGPDTYLPDYASCVRPKFDVATITTGWN